MDLTVFQTLFRWCANPGDVVMTNRQALHGSFANTSSDKRVTFNFGFHRRTSVLNVRTRDKDTEVIYNEERIHERSCLIALGIDAGSSVTLTRSAMFTNLWLDRRTPTGGMKKRGKAF